MLNVLYLLLSQGIKKSAKEILSGEIPQPIAAKILYEALRDLMLPSDELETGLMTE